MSMSLTKTVLAGCLNPNFVETGTGEGGGVHVADQCGFENIVTIDTHEPSLAKAKAICPRAVTHLGDSSSLLGEVIYACTGPITFWLDAHTHYPGQPLETTVLEELAIIARRWRKGNIVLVDDWSWFGSKLWGVTCSRYELAVHLAKFIEFGCSVNRVTNTLGVNDILLLKEVD